MRKFWFSLLLLSVCTVEIQAQSLPHYQIWQDSVEVASFQADPYEEVAVIVQFKQAPLLSSEAFASKTNRIAAIEADHTQFGNDLQELRRNSGSASKMSQDRPVGFRNVFNGASVRVERWMMQSLAELSYVESVFVDGEVTVQAGATNSAAVAQSQMQGMAGTGRGVKIAVIDTGVDYMHADLGSGFGAGYKVAGGYDFVNDDADPMDDNGHGTHVAGVAAADGTSFHGLAPDATLLAYKVLDAGGYGKDSWVLAAIERALDPDQNPMTDDGADIINMSLGGPAGGDAQSPVTLAVERAIEAGVVCVIAAGNSGRAGAATVSAPGNAISAITVGAADNNLVANFSAQGPTGAMQTLSLPRFGLKPDLVAPGVSIESTWIGGGYHTLDGTSMATPYVAGLAARLLESQPNWTPAKIKAALVQSARDLQIERHRQGAGLVDSMAVTPASIVEPASISLGMIDAEDVVLSHTLTIHNESDAVKIYTLETNGALPAGFDVRFSQNQVQVAAGQSVSVEVRFDVNPSAIPALDFPNGYQAEIAVSEGLQTTQVPFSFYKTHHGRLQIDGAADFVFVHGRNQDQPITLFNAGSSTFLMLPGDTYDFIAQFDSGRRVVVRENIQLTAGVEVAISPAEATHKVALTPRDRSGRLLEDYSGFHALVHKATGFSLVRQGGFLSIASELDGEQFFSDLSDAYRLDVKVAGFDDAGSFYEIPFSIEKGIDAHIALENDPAQFSRQAYRNMIATNEQRVLFLPWTTVQTGSTQRASISALFDATAGSPFWMSAPFEKDVYTMPAPSADYRWQGHFFTLHTADFSLPRLATNSRSITLFESGATEFVNGTLNLGGATVSTEELDNALTRWAGRLDVSASQIRIQEDAQGGFFVDAFGGLIPNTHTYALYRGDDEVLTDSIFGTPRLPVLRKLGADQIDVTPGTYRLEVSNQSMQFGLSTAELTFDTNRSDANPPQISRLFVADAGSPVFSLEKNRSYELIADIVDVCAWCSADEAAGRIEQVEAWIRLAGNADWTPVTMIESTDGYRAVLEGFEVSGKYALKISATDVSGNRMLYTVQAAFDVEGQDLAAPVLTEPAIGTTIASENAQMTWLAVANVQSYRIQVATDSLFVDVVKDWVETDATSLPANDLEEGKKYFWRVGASNEKGATTWSTSFWFETQVAPEEEITEEIQADYALGSIYPNPARERATLQFEIPENADVRITVYDVLGREVMTAVNENRSAGFFNEPIDLSNLAAGAYFVHLQANEFTATARLVRVD